MITIRNDDPLTVADLAEELRRAIAAGDGDCMAKGDPVSQELFYVAADGSRRVLGHVDGPLRKIASEDLLGVVEQRHGPQIPGVVATK